MDEASELEKPTIFTKDKPLSLVLSLRIHDQFSLQDPSQSIRTPTFPLTLSLTKKSPSETSYLLSNKNLSDEHIFNLFNLSSSTIHDTSLINQPTPSMRGPAEPSMIDSIPISAKQLERIERRNRRYKFQREIITIAKKSIKPSYQKHYITKNEYKIIMKKVVTKAIYSNKIDQKSIDKNIHSYVKKYRIKQ